MKASRCMTDELKKQKRSPEHTPDASQPRHNKSSLELDPFSVNVLLSIMILYENVSEGNVLSEIKVLLSFSRSGDFLSADAVFHELDDGC